MENKTPEQQKIAELEESNKALSFFSNQTNFNSIIYQSLLIIIDKLTKMEEKINLPELPDLKDGK